MTDADIRLYFDPVCPFAWMTSKWVRTVAAQRDYAVDYDSHFPAGYEEGHASGLRLLRVAARVRASTGAPPSDRSTRPSAARSSTPRVPPS